MYVFNGTTAWVIDVIGLHTYNFICSKISNIPTKSKGTELDEKVVNTDIRP